MDVRVYGSTKEFKIKKLLLESLFGFKKGAYLARLFVVRGYKAKYKASYVGFLWEIMPSITTGIVWIFLKESGAVDTAAVNIPFPLFVICGTIIWSLITESINKPLGVLNEYTSIISKINIPKEALLLIGFYSVLINHFIKLILVFIMLVLFQVVPTISLLYYIPLVVLTIIFFMAIGLLLMPFEYMLPDIGKLKNYGLMGLMYLTPVVYANPGKGLLAKIMQYNPLSVFVDGMRNALTGRNVDVLFFGWVFIITLIMVALSLIVFKVTVPIITERIGA